MDLVDLATFSEAVVAFMSSPHHRATHSTGGIASASGGALGWSVRDIVLEYRQCIDMHHPCDSVTSHMIRTVVLLATGRVRLSTYYLHVLLRLE